MDIGDRAHEQFSKQIYTLRINNVTIKDNGAYKVQVTYTEGEHDVAVVIGTKKLYVNGTILIF